MNKLMTESRSPWFESLEISRLADLRVFALPFAGGTSYAYRGWQAELTENIQLCPVQLPGRGRRLKESAHTKMTELVTELAGALAPHCDMPFVLFGHSMGGIIGFEVAWHLQQRFGLEPRMLLVSGCTAAHLLHYSRRIYDLPEGELIKEIKAFGGTHLDVLENSEIMRILLPVLRADLELIQTYSYRPGTLINSRIHAFVGSEDFGDPENNVKPWADLTTGRFDISVLPGGHFFPFTARYRFMDRLRAVLHSCRNEIVFRN